VPAEPGGSGHRAGFAALAGRPNVGKSTLVNALVGAKVAIVSPQPQTTRRLVRGVVHRPDAQLILVDTPGLHRPRTLLGERLNDAATSALSEVDVVLFCVPADEAIGPGDRRIAAQLGQLRDVPVFAVVTKIDRVDRGRLAGQLSAVAALGAFTEVVPVSAVTGEQVSLLVDLLVDRLPASPPLYPPGKVTDASVSERVVELIREAALEGVREELPHSLAVTVEEFGPRADRPELFDVYATVYVERPSQKAIVLGSGGERMRRVGTQARGQIEALLGRQVYLNLHVKVAKDWQRDPRQLHRLGF